MKTRILSLTTLIALLLTLAACSSDEAPDNFEPRLVTGEASGVTRTEAVIAGEVVLQEAPTCRSCASDTARQTRWTTPRVCLPPTATR